MKEIDKLRDDNNCESILLYNTKGEPVSFDQVAVIPIEDKEYFILKPISPIEGVGDDEGLVFTVGVDEDGNENLNLVNDRETVDAVFDIYDELIAEELGDDV